MHAPGAGGWAVLGVAANLAMVLALLICVATRATVAAVVIVPSLIALAAYAEWRAETRQHPKGGPRGH